MRVLYEDKDQCYLALLVNDIILLAAYIAPSRADAKLQEILAKAEELSDGFQKQIIVFGDLNARLGEATGDSAINPRGRLLLEELVDSQLSIQKPISGKWTSFNRGGCGIPDIVLANFDVESVTVHELESLGGSDHRPITFKIPDRVDPDAGTKHFTRWNIRKLSRLDQQQKYKDQLAVNVDTILRTIQTSLDSVRQQPGRTVGGHSNGGPSSNLLSVSPTGTDESLVMNGSSQPNANHIQHHVDQSWNAIKSWIEQAAETTIGTLVVHDRLPEDFWTDEMEATREAIIEAISELQDAITSERPSLTPAEIEARSKALTQSQRSYRVSLKQRRTKLFEDAVDNLAEPQNLSSFLRMTKNARARQTKSGCKLDPDAIDTHAQHFVSTFGGQPTGQVIPRGQPARLFNFKSTAQLVTEESVEVTMKRLPLGKASGPDNIPAELIYYGGSAMVRVFTKFLTLVHKTSTIPSEWRNATIVPVYKNKGSPSDIAMHRPIALTCTGRRLYERVLLPELVHLAIATLDDTQAGFRPSRSTLDQVMVLHEILSGAKEAFAVLLDLKAAYDMVDRDILWKELETYFGVSAAAIQRLQDLFDKNQSMLVVAGKMSIPIPNARGLLQGSTLSPILFNFFIDPLCRRLKAIEMPTIAVHGVRVNRLLFADDTSLVASNTRDMAKLLKTCEDWSRDVGMQFAPQKCVVLGPPINRRDVALKMYGVDLPSETSALYLGVPFNSSGICWKEMVLARTTKAKQVIASLAPIGFNARGWAPAASARIYKAFIRPVMEYGLALYGHGMPANLLTYYERVQTMALRTLTSTPRNTSKVALMKLLQVEPMSYRAKILNLNWAARLNSSGDEGNLAVKVFHYAIQPARTPHKNSLPKLAMQNSLWNHPEINKPHPQLQRAPLAVQATRPLPLLEKQKLKKQAIVDLADPKPGGVGDAIEVTMSDRVRPFLQPKSGISREDRWLLLQWTLGAVTRHEECKKCTDMLTRAHAATCSGADLLLKTLHEDVPPPLCRRHTRIDAVLNKYRSVAPSKSTAYSSCLIAIKLILTKCRGLRRRQEDGYWTNQDQSDNEEPPPRPAAPPPPRSAASIIRSARSARLAQERNRPRGRPPNRPRDVGGEG